MMASIEKADARRDNNVGFTGTSGRVSGLTDDVTVARAHMLTGST